MTQAVRSSVKPGSKSPESVGKMLPHGRGLVLGQGEEPRLAVLPMR